MAMTGNEIYANLSDLLGTGANSSYTNETHSMIINAFGLKNTEANALLLQELAGISPGDGDIGPNTVAKISEALQTDPNAFVLGLKSRGEDFVPTTDIPGSSHTLTIDFFKQFGLTQSLANDITLYANDTGVPVDISRHTAPATETPAPSAEAEAPAPAALAVDDNAETLGGRFGAAIAAFGLDTTRGNGRMIQEAAGLSGNDLDGLIGPKSRAAIKATLETNPTEFFQKLKDQGATLEGVNRNMLESYGLEGAALNKAFGEATRIRLGIDAPVQMVTTEPAAEDPVAAMNAATAAAVAQVTTQPVTQTAPAAVNGHYAGQTVGDVAAIRGSSHQARALQVLIMANGGDLSGYGADGAISGNQNALKGETGRALTTLGINPGDDFEVTMQRLSASAGQAKLKEAMSSLDPSDAQFVRGVFGETGVNYQASAQEQAADAVGTAKRTMNPLKYADLPPEVRGLLSAERPMTAAATMSAADEAVLATTAKTAFDAEFRFARSGIKPDSRISDVKLLDLIRSNGGQLHFGIPTGNRNEVALASFDIERFRGEDGTLNKAELQKTFREIFQIDGMVESNAEFGYRKNQSTQIGSSTGNPYFNHEHFIRSGHEELVNVDVLQPAGGSRRARVEIDAVERGRDGKAAGPSTGPGPGPSGPSGGPSPS